MNCDFSDMIITTNGVKQGGVLSPILLSIYMNELLKRLKQQLVGYRTGNNLSLAVFQMHMTGHVFVLQYMV